MPKQAATNHSRKSNRSEFRILDAAVESLCHELAGLRENQAVKEAANGLATGTVAFDRTLGVLAHEGRNVLERVQHEHTRVAEREVRADVLYREALRKQRERKKPRRTPRARKGAYIVHGRLVDPDTEKPISGALVEAINKDPSEDDLRGVDITDDSGRFQFAFRARDFAELGADLPELVVRAGSDRSAMFEITKKPLKLEPGKALRVDVVLPRERLLRIRPPLGDQNSDTAQMSALNVERTKNRLQQEQLETAIATATNLLTRLADAVRGRADRSSRGAETAGGPSETP